MKNSEQATEKSLIVYVDDDTDDLQFVKEALVNYHASLEVVTFDSPSKAFDYFLQRETAGISPCLIILDINMPGISGKELLPSLRNIPHFSQIPMILFSTSNTKQDKQFASQHGAGFVTKPMDYKQMAFIAEQFLQHCTDDVKKRMQP